MAESDPLVAVVLPPREGFGPGRTGAVGLIAQRLAAAPGPFRTLVIGGAQDGDAFAGAAVPRRRRRAWCTGATSTSATPPPSPRALRPLPPGADRGAQPARTSRSPSPAGCRGAGLPVPAQRPAAHARAPARPAERADLLRRLARVVTVSGYPARPPAGRHRAAAGRMPAVLPNCIDLAALPPPPARARTLILFAGRVVAGQGRRTSSSPPAPRALPAPARLARRDHRRRPLRPRQPRHAASSARSAPRAAAAGVSLLGYRAARRTCSRRWRAPPSWWCPAAGRSRSA